MASISISNFIFFSSHLYLTYFAAPAAPTATICDDTPFPYFCLTALLFNNSAPTTAPTNLHDSGRRLILKSIATATKFLKIINQKLAASSSSPIATIRALQDCQHLSQRNINFLLSTYQIVKSGKTSLPKRMSEDGQTMLSAVLTNAVTCLDVIKDNGGDSWMTRINGFNGPIQNDNKLYSTSLSLFNKAWGNANKKKHDTSLKNGGLPPFKMSPVFEAAAGGRKLLQDGGAAGISAVVSSMVVVSKDGSWNFTTITDAINFAPYNTANSSDGYFMIYVKAGVYEEYVYIPENKKYLMMVGDGINQTVITGNHNNDDGWSILSSGTLIVEAGNFIAVNLTIRNTAGPAKHQAVALRSGADLSTFYRCSFEGYQDTLFADSLRQFYRECDIYGTIDFIFGNAAMVLQKCNIYVRLPIQGQFNTITAQGRMALDQNTGISIQWCNIRAADDLAAGGGTTKTYLGRPWKEFSRTVYMQSYMDTLINPAGWSVWDGDFALNTLYYAEFMNVGPASDTSRRVTWPGFHVIDGTVAVNFTASVFIPDNEFLPQTGVPYDQGLS